MNGVRIELCIAWLVKPETHGLAEVSNHIDKRGDSRTEKQLLVVNARDADYRGPQLSPTGWVGPTPNRKPQ